MSNRTFLVTRTRYDETMNYLFYWAGEVIKEAQKKDFDVIDIKEEKVNKKDFVGRVKKTQPGLIYLNGHGNADCISGHENQILLQVNNNEDLLHGKIIYALSCRSARIFGKSCINKGTRSYIGYDEDFMFLFEQDKITHPLEDQTAELFFKPSNLLVINLLKENTSGESFERSQKEFRRNIRKLLASKSPQDDKASIPYLLWDMTHQVCLGDRSAKL